MISFTLRPLYCGVSVPINMYRRRVRPQSRSRFYAEGKGSLRMVRVEHRHTSRRNYAEERICGSSCGMASYLGECSYRDHVVHVRFLSIWRRCKDVITRMGTEVPE